MDIKHTIRISNNITKLQVIGDSEYDNALQSTLISVELGDNCKELGPSCFINCKNLEYVKMPKTCRVIGEYAFYGCENLKYVTCIDKNDCYPVFEYGAHAFDGCTNLSNLIIWGSPNIGEYAFTGCTSITSVSIDSDTKEIGAHAFDGCSNLESVIIWGDDTLVGKDAFANCPKLKDRPIQD